MEKNLKRFGVFGIISLLSYTAMVVFSFFIGILVGIQRDIIDKARADMKAFEHVNYCLAIRKD